MLVVKVLYIIACFVLIGSVLMQSGKSAGLSGSIAGGAEQLFGKQKGRQYDSLFDRITKVGAIAFMILALTITVMQ
ncbi:MAG: preprotein translocase subunit SecG [Acidaminobacteraceae bacterium]